MILLALCSELPEPLFELLCSIGHCASGFAEHVFENPLARDVVAHSSNMIDMPGYVCMWREVRNLMVSLYISGHHCPADCPSSFSCPHSLGTQFDFPCVVLPAPSP